MSREDGGRQKVPKVKSRDDNSRHGRQSASQWGYKSVYWWGYKSGSWWGRHEALAANMLQVNS